MQHLWRTVVKGLAMMALFGAIFFVTAEIALRIYFRDGETFGVHVGPIVARFERDFSCNRFDGPSRGPQLAGPKEPGIVRILVQGDSITWGQGIRDENLLYSTRLLERLRQRLPAIEMAVLARPGREIDAHLAQLDEWGEEISPDVIVYQFHVNDVELDKSNRPGTQSLLFRALFHRLFIDHSYFWFIVRHHAGQLVGSRSGASYSDYLDSNFRSGTPGWAAFESVFREWAASARALTPRVMIIIYPFVKPPAEILFSGIYQQLESLASETGVVILPYDSVMDSMIEDISTMHASRFDGHPGPDMHGRIAAVLERGLMETWPELFAVAPAVADGGTAIDSALPEYSCEKDTHQQKTAFMPSTSTAQSMLQ